MKTTMRVLFSLAFVATPVAVQQYPQLPRQANVITASALADKPSENQESNAVDDYIKTAMSRQHISGLSLVVIRDGKIIKAKGYGLASLELRVPANPETVYELASATKPFVATAILLLVQDKKIGLEDKIDKLLENTPESWKPITVRHLLTHTSGIKCYLTDMRHDFPYDTSPEEFARVVGKEPLLFAPGEKWSYSNTGYVLLGMIVNRVSGRSFHAFLEERVFKPLGMMATRSNRPDEIVPNRTVGYLWAGEAGLRNADFLKYLMMNQGDAGILSTVLDLAKFEAALSTDRLLLSSIRMAMWSPVKLNNGKTHDYGFGWFLDQVNGHKHISHPGGNPGTATMISRYPDDKLTIIFLTNGGAAYVQGLDFGIAQRYVPGLVSRKVIRLDPTVLDSYTGYYNAYGSQVLKVTREKTALVLDDGGRLAGEFLPLSETEFVAEDADRGFTLTRAGDGDVSGMVLRLGQDKMKVQRIGPLFGSLKPQPGSDPGLTRKVEAVLKALAQGGNAVEKIGDFAPQARKDFSHGSTPAFRGIESIVLIGAQSVAGRGIERHGARVSRILYVRIHTDQANRNVLVYLTQDGLVTDEDLLGDFD